jgi:hypothetical protein
MDSNTAYDNLFGPSTSVYFNGDTVYGAQDGPLAPSVPDSTGTATPFDNLGRLTDKMFGVAILAVDNVAADMQVKNAALNRTTKIADTQTAIVSWVKVNITLIMLAIATFLLFRFARR